MPVLPRSGRPRFARRCRSPALPAQDAVTGQPPGLAGTHGLAAPGAPGHPGESLPGVPAGLAAAHAGRSAGALGWWMRQRPVPGTAGNRHLAPARVVAVHRGSSGSGSGDRIGSGRRVHGNRIGRIGGVSSSPPVAGWPGKHGRRAVTSGAPHHVARARCHRKPQLVAAAEPVGPLRRAAHGASRLRLMAL